MWWCVRWNDAIELNEPKLWNDMYNKALWNAKHPSSVLGNSTSDFYIYWRWTVDNKHGVSTIRLHGLFFPSLSLFLFFCAFFLTHTHSFCKTPFLSYKEHCTPLTGKKQDRQTVMVMETSDVDGNNEQRKHVKLFQRSKTSLRRIMSRSSHTRVNSSDSLGSSVSTIRVRESSNSSSDDTQATATTTTTTTAPRLVLRVSVLRARQLHAFEVNKVFLCVYMSVCMCAYATLSRIG